MAIHWNYVAWLISRQTGSFEEKLQNLPLILPALCSGLHLWIHMNCHMGSEGVDFFGISECNKGQAHQEEWYSETHGLFCEHPKQEVIQVTDFQRGGDDTQT